MTEYITCFHACTLLSKFFIWPEITLFFLSHLANSYSSFKIHLNCHLLQEAYCLPNNSWLRWLYFLNALHSSIAYKSLILFFCVVVYNFSCDRYFILFHLVFSKPTTEPSSLFIISCHVLKLIGIEWMRSNRDF